MQLNCGSSPLITYEDPVHRANLAVAAITFGFNFLETPGRVIVKDLGFIQETCQHNPNALNYHYIADKNLSFEDNIEIFAMRCMIAHYNPSNPILSNSLTLYITDGDDEHICEETMLGIMEVVFSANYPKNFQGKELDPFVIANSWCKCYGEDEEKLNCSN